MTDTGASTGPIEATPAVATTRPTAPRSAAGPVRLDVWLNAVRLAPSRAAATKDCEGGRIRVAGATAKPARKVKVGDEIEVRQRVCIEQAGARPARLANRSQSALGFTRRRPDRRFVRKHGSGGDEIRGFFVEREFRHCLKQFSGLHVHALEMQCGRSRIEDVPVTSKDIRVNDVDRVSCDKR